VEQVHEACAKAGLTIKQLLSRMMAVEPTLVRRMTAHSMQFTAAERAERMRMVEQLLGGTQQTRWPMSLHSTTFRALTWIKGSEVECMAPASQTCTYDDKQHTGCTGEWPQHRHR
jgi:hypothetical protein